MQTTLFTFLILFSSAVFANSEIPNFIKVSDQIYRGGRPSPQGILTLKALGVKTDINLQGGDIVGQDPATNAFMEWWEPGETSENIAREKTQVESLQIDFISAPLNSILEVDDREDATIDRVLEIMNEPSAQPVFIHCEHGKDRTGLVIALYKIKFQRMTVEAAYAEWAEAGHRGLGAYFTGNLDTYFYRKANRIRSALL